MRRLLAMVVIQLDAEQTAEAWDRGVLRRAAGEYQPSSDDAAAATPRRRSPGAADASKPAAQWIASESPRCPVCSAEHSRGRCAREHGGQLPVLRGLRLL